MPIPGKRWYHVTFGTYASWLPGDRRGFRARNHKIHSSGDHKRPPPKGEHAGLHAFSQGIGGSRVVIPQALRETVCVQIVQTLLRRDHRVLVCAVSGLHAHLLAELLDDRGLAKEEVGVTKKSASQAVSDALPGKVWARGCGLKPIRDEAHQRSTFLYIQRHIDNGAFVWAFREAMDRGPVD